MEKDTSPHAWDGKSPELLLWSEQEPTGPAEPQTAHQPVQLASLLPHLWNHHGIPCASWLLTTLITLQMFQDQDVPRALSIGGLFHFL